jgi:hypothetical protein
VKRRAECSCGQLAVEVEGDPVRISMCHCLACQRRTGSVFGAQARWPNDRVSITGRSTEYMRVGDSGNHALLHFCPTCGSTVYWYANGQPELTAVAIGAFADPSFPTPRFSVYEDRKHAWVHVPDDAEHL